MTAVLPKKVAFRAEHTGDVARDRMQRMAQQVGQAHEATKLIVTALANQSYVALTTDKTLATSASYATLLTASINSVLPSSSLVITVTTSCAKITNAGTGFFRVLVDNVTAKGAAESCSAVPEAWSSSILMRVPVTQGTHTVALQWRTDTNSLRINAASAAEEHASMLVQEAP